MFHVGQKVVCIYAGNIPGNPHATGRFEASEALVEGNVYTVRKYYHNEWGAQVWLDEVARSAMSQKRWGVNVGYNADRFRPVIEKKTDISIFARILDDVSKRGTVKCP
jgi:hypothetical protein